VNIVECAGVGRRYGRAWGLRDCTLAIPAGHVVALVGPNGAGKTTLLHILVGLLSPTAGAVAVLDGVPAGSPAALDGIAFVAQDAPLYKNLPAGEMLRVARYLNWHWDQERAETRLAELGIPLHQKVGSLSGGQQAQLALTVALARRPALLVLDEPLAWLDPLARHDFMASLMAAVAGDGMSVIMSSHVLAELEPVADYLVMLSAGQVQVAGEVDDLLASHRVLTGPAGESGRLADRMCVLQCRGSDVQAHLLVRTTKPAEQVPPGWESRPVTLQELVLAYLRQPGAAALPGPTPVSTDHAAEVQA
jgi:ABC-2 type transport system ATP-binding protein